jgi:hypothetical protein
MVGTRVGWLTERSGSPVKDFLDERVELMEEGVLLEVIECLRH